MSDMPASAPGPRRAAWVLVLIMSVLLVLAFVAVVWGFVRQGRILLAGRAAAPAAAQSLATLTLAPGARIVSARTDGGRLVLQVSAPGGDEVDVIDLATGRRTLQVRTRP